jgi:hypothetical protein
MTGGLKTRLQWQLEGSFQEDPSRLDLGQPGTNLRILRRTASILLKNNRSKRAAIKTKRPNPGWDKYWLCAVLLG